MISGVPGFGRQPETDEYGNPIEPPDVLSAGAGGSAPAAPQAPASPAAAIQIVQPPEVSTRTEWSRTGPRDSREEVKPHPETAKALAESDAQTPILADIAVREEVREKQRLEHEQAIADARLKANTEFEQRRQDERRMRDAVISQRLAEEDQRQAQMEASGKITDYWADRSTPAKILSAVLVGMGEYAAIKGGGQNRAAQIFQSAMDRDRQLKMDQFARSKEFAAIARQNTEAARELWDKRLAEIDVEQAAQGKLLVDQVDAMAAKLKNAGAADAAAKLRAIVAQKAADDKAKRWEKYDPKTSHTDAVRTSGGGTTQNFSAGGAAGGKDLVVYGPDGKPLAVAPSPVEKKNAQEGVDAYRKLNATLDKLEENFRKHGSTEIMDRGAVGDRESLVADAQLQMKELKKLGMLDAGTERFMSRMIPTGGVLSSDKEVFAKLNTLRGTARDELRLNMDRIGVRGADVVATVDAAKNRPPAAGPDFSKDPGGDIDLSKPGGKAAPKVPKTKETAREASEALTWAKAHPNDPRAREIIRRVGGIARE